MTAVDQIGSGRSAHPPKKAICADFGPRLIAPEAGNEETS
jgi:hypothetical protein